jgi:hypothetical protein
MGKRYYGGTGQPSLDVIPQPGGELVTDRTGLVTGRMIFKVKPKRWDLYPQVGAVHPDAAFVTMEKRTVRRTPGWWHIIADYAGVETEESEVIYDLQRSTQREPIETHPEFVEKLGGKPSEPKNGAIFVDQTGWPTTDDELGVFERFRITLKDGEEVSKNPFAGVDAYLAPTNTTWVGQWASRARPTPGEGVGKIDENPEGNPPDYGEEFSWLYTGLSYQSRGSAKSVRKEWLLGRWLEPIYGNSE